MQIPQQLPQFEDKKILIVVCGNQSGLFYLASNGLIEKVNEIKIETPHYSDKEGFFAQGTKMGTAFSGSVNETPKHEVWSKFIREAVEYIDTFNKKESIDGIYLYCAPEIINEFKEKIPNPLKSLVSKEFRGTYLKKSPVELLEMIK